uniref:Uncharacterized protein n=1 Tax=uncultured Flavobacteriia bacterium TaxID=212695 RepID=H6RF87_9BACT|nr:hypothetical protein VIS_S18BRA80026 [uncultured Flavobacteriia bacterium]
MGVELQLKKQYISTNTQGNKHTDCLGDVGVYDGFNSRFFGVNPYSKYY